MKTQNMVIDIAGYPVKARTDGMIEFASLSDAGNSIRRSKGRKNANITKYMEGSRANELIQALIDADGGSEYDYHRIEGKGNQKRRMVCIELAVHIAMHMDSDFELQVIRAFIEGKILSNRLEGGDKFKALNIAIDAHLPEREGKASNKGVYIQVAKMIRDKCEVEAGTETDPTWNGFSADSISQQMRLEMEKKLITFLQLGLIKNYQHMKEVIEQL